MKGQKKKQNGITLIALVISIIVMLILAGVSINALMGDNGILRQAQFASFMSEMAAVEEAVQLWGADHYDDANHSIPANGVVPQNEMEKGERLVGEVGYYRDWSTTNIMPSTSILSDAASFNNAFKGELVYFPGGTEDVFYLDNDGLNLNSNKKYIIDAANSMIYSIQGISLNGVRCYSLAMAKAVMNGVYDAPTFAEAEVSGSQTGDGKVAVGNHEPQYIDDGNGNLIENPNYNEYGFEIIAEASNPNLYKLYNNGKLYAKGSKGILLNSSDDEMKSCDQFSWVYSSIPSIIPGANDNSCQIINGYDTVYAIDKNGYLWAWGDNSLNKMGLSEEEQINFSSYVAQKLDVDGKKVKKVIGTNWSTFVVTEDDYLYASGGDLQGELGIGEKKMQTIGFELIDFPEDPNNIKEIGNAYSGQTTSQGEGFSFILTNTKLYFCGRCSVRCPNVKLVGYTTNPEAITKWTEVDVATMFPGLSCSTAHISGSQQWWEQPYWYFYQDNLCYKMYVNGSVSKQDDLSGGTKLDIWSAMNDGSLIRVVKNGTAKYYCSIGPSVVNSLGTVDASGNPSFSQGTYDVTSTFTSLETTDKTIASIWSNIGATIVKMSNGEIYGSGLATNLGIGESAGQKSWTRLTGLENLGKTFEFPQSAKTLLFITSSGEIIGTNKLNLVLGENVLEKSWVEIQDNVKMFNASTDGYTFAFVGTDGYLYVRGSRSNHLGLNKVNEKINTLTKVDGAGATTDVVNALKTGVKKYFIRTDAIYILTNSGSLLISCYNYRGQSNNWGTYYYGMGTEQHPELVEMTPNVIDFDASTSFRGIVEKSDGVYTWGMSRAGYLTSDSHGLVEICNKTVWNGAGSWISATCGLDNGFVIGSNYVVSQISGGTQISPAETFVKVVSGGAWLFLTDTGNLYGFGNSKYLGDGQGSLGTSVEEISKVNSGNNFVNVICGSNFAIAYTADGKVFGTGTNQLGILGRWKGAPRTAGRYRTAFEWVECPELEI